MATATAYAFPDDVNAIADPAGPAGPPSKPTPQNDITDTSGTTVNDVHLDEILQDGIDEADGIRLDDIVLHSSTSGFDPSDPLSFDPSACFPTTSTSKFRARAQDCSIFKQEANQAGKDATVAEGAPVDSTPSTVDDGSAEIAAATVDDGSAEIAAASVDEKTTADANLPLAPGAWLDAFKTAAADVPPAPDVPLVPNLPAASNSPLVQDAVDPDVVDPNLVDPDVPVAPDDPILQNLPVAQDLPITEDDTSNYDDAWVNELSAANKIRVYWCSIPTLAVIQNIPVCSIDGTYFNRDHLSNLSFGTLADIVTGYTYRKVMRATLSRFMLINYLLFRSARQHETSHSLPAPSSQGRMSFSSRMIMNPFPNEEKKNP